MDLSATIHLLGSVLGNVIEEQENTQAYSLVEDIRLAAKARRSGDLRAGQELETQIQRLDTEEARIIAAAFSLYFDLVNLAEESYRVSVLRQEERENHPIPVHDSIREAFCLLKQAGVSREEIAELLAQLQIQLVLTAHPTEAKRRTILSKLERIADLLQTLTDPEQLPRENQENLQALHDEITLFWLTDRARTDRPAVTDEVRTGLYFVDRVFWSVLPAIYQALDEALAEYYPGVSTTRTWLSLASWIGGDRDGNPNVTTAVTAESLRLHRGLAVSKHRSAFQEIARRLSLSAQRCPPPQDLLNWFRSRHPLPPHVAYLERRYAAEPYRLALSLLADDLAQASEEDVTANLLAEQSRPARLDVQDITIPSATS